MCFCFSIFHAASFCVHFTTLKGRARRKIIIKDATVSLGTPGEKSQVNVSKLKLGVRRPRFIAGWATVVVACRCRVPQAVVL